MTCENCRTVSPIEDEGTVMIRHPESSTEAMASWAYSSLEELMKLLEESSPVWSGISAESAELAILPSPTVTGEGNLPNNIPVSWLALSAWQGRLRHIELIRIMERKQFRSFMQPIVRTRDESIYGYEFLLRPAESGPPFSPYELFRAAQETGFHSFLDRAARISAIETSARCLPHGFKRFVNFLPSSIYNPAYCLSHTFAAIRKFQLDPSDFVFEVVETEQIADIPHLGSIFEAYKSNGVKVALDDVGAGFSTLEVLDALKPDYVKIDRELVSYCDQHTDRRQQLKAILDLSLSFGATVLAEGLERREELEVCRELGVDLVQGYLFGKPAAEPIA